MYTFIGTISVYAFDSASQGFAFRAVLDDPKINVKALGPVYAMHYEDKVLHAGCGTCVVAWDLDVKGGVCKLKGTKELTPQYGPIVAFAIYDKILLCAQSVGTVDGLNMGSGYESVGPFTGIKEVLRLFHQLIEHHRHEIDLRLSKRTCSSNRNG